jgi:hypothetical protein
MDFDRLKRREFITLVGGAAARLCGRSPRAQQPKIFRLGYLDPDVRSDPTAQNLRRQRYSRM